MTPARNLGDIVRPPAAADGTAYIDVREEGAESWTAGAFDRAIDAVAFGLQSAGLGPGARVGILCGNRPEALHLYFGAMRAGLTAVPINHRLAPDTIAYIVADAGIDIIFADARHLPLVPAGPGRRVIGTTGPQGFDAFVAGADMAAFESVAPGPDLAAKILYTSGSTGKPKGVLLTHPGQCWSIEASLVRNPPGDARILVAAPYYHKNGLFNATVGLASGIPVVALPRFDARLYLRTIATHRCTMLSGVPTMFALMARELDLLEALDFAHVQQVSVGSAPLSEALAATIAAMFPNAVVSNGYGTTEAGPVVFGPHPGGLPRPITSIGYPAHGVRLRIDGEGGDGDGGEGELLLSTPAMMAGYVGAPDLTRQRLVDGWYRTGDVVRRDQDGFFYFVGRVDDMFVCGGENIFPVEVERLLERHPDVVQAAVVPAPDDIKGQVPVAFVVPRAGAELSEAALKRFALDHGPAYSHPRAVVMLDSLPLATTHKVDRSTLMQTASAVARARGRIGVG